MNWEWKSKDDKSGTIIFDFVYGSINIELPDFGTAHNLAQLIHEEIQAAKLPGATEKPNMNQITSVENDNTDGTKYWCGATDLELQQQDRIVRLEKGLRDLLDAAYKYGDWKSFPAYALDDAERALGN